MIFFGLGPWTEKVLFVKGSTSFSILSSLSFFTIKWTHQVFFLTKHTPIRIRRGLVEPTASPLRFPSIRGCGSVFFWPKYALFSQWPLRLLYFVYYVRIFFLLNSCNYWKLSSLSAGNERKFNYDYSFQSFSQTEPGVRFFMIKGNMPHSSTWASPTALMTSPCFRHHVFIVSWEWWAFGAII